jgi:integrase
MASALPTRYHAQCGKKQGNANGSGTDARRRKDGRYERTCRNHLPPFFGRLKLRDLTPAHVRAFKARKLDDGLHPNTVGSMQGVLSRALNQAVDDGLIAANPASRVKAAAARGQQRMRALSHEQVVAAAEGTRDEALIAVALRTGIRQGELAAFRWEDVDLAGGSGNKPGITVCRSADTRTRPRVSTTKSDEERRVGIGPRTVATLSAHRARQLEERMASTARGTRDWYSRTRAAPSGVGGR